MSRIALIADIHGNVLALEAVLRDLARRDVDGVFNLGDALYGPLCPVETFELLASVPMTHLAGNGDRELIEPRSAVPESPENLASRLGRTLDEKILAWIREMPFQTLSEDIFFCHASPASDTEYLLEDVANVSEGMLHPKSPEAVEAVVGDIPCSLVACAHSHLPRVVRLDSGKLVVNPGSVGLPAYEKTVPVPHRMESLSPHARYAVAERAGCGWSVEQFQVAYDWEAMARVAEQNGSPEWGHALRTGRVRCPAR